MEKPDIFAELKERTRKLMERLEAAPVQDLTGLVGASWPSGSHIPPETSWTLLISLVAWRIGSGEIQKREMTVRRAMTEHEVGIWRDTIKPYSVFRARARVVDDPQFVRPDAKLEEILATDVIDQALNEYARELQEPVTYDDPVFGRFVLDRGLDMYRGNVAWNGINITVDLSVSESGEFQSSLATLRQLWRDRVAWDARITDYAVQKLLPLKNGSWLDEDEGDVALGADDFKAKMNLDGISVNQDSFTFWYSDGDMFLGHTIEICGDLSEGPTSADIPG